MKEMDYAYWPSRSKWFDIGYDLLVLANDCLADTPFGSPKEMFMSIEEPDFTCCDFISVHMQVIRPIQYGVSTFPEENFQPRQKCDKFYWVPRYEITVGRPCRPILGNGTFRPTEPSPRERTEYARNVFYDAETMPCCILSKIDGGYELGGQTFNDSAASVFPQQVYTETFGPCSRMRFRIMFDHDSCCDPEERGYEDDDWVHRQMSEGPLGAELPNLPSGFIADEIRGA